MHNQFPVKINVIRKRSEIFNKISNRKQNTLISWHSEFYISIIFLPLVFQFCVVSNVKFSTKAQKFSAPNFQFWLDDKLFFHFTFPYILQIAFLLQHFTSWIQHLHPIMLTIEYGKVEKVADDLEKTSFVNGRITLLKTTLSSLPIYYLSASVIPREVQCSLESDRFSLGRKQNR